eukprot:TRINITY_DN8953_c2_g1_i3.p1 TRINITY_DN8953_c2_g1~~TRINITY_DN8953_c2_g1_i3.p1  ORF type:complete len:699 (-),score=273.35 TRINITY_DN8953_c2_g1_i3:217-2313(-)
MCFVWSGGQCVTCGVGGRRCALLECTQQQLLLFTTDCTLYQYRLAATAVNSNGQQQLRSVQLQLVREVSARGHLPLQLPPLSLSLLPPPARHLPATAFGKLASARGCGSPTPPDPAAAAGGWSEQEQEQELLLLMLTAGGTLLLTSTADLSHQAVLATQVELVWVASQQRLAAHAPVAAVTAAEGELADDELELTLWAYGQRGLHLWLPHLHDAPLQASQLLSRDNSLEFDLEVYPIGFVSELGVIVGLTQEVHHAAHPSASTSAPTGVASFVEWPWLGGQLKTHPFVHCMLAHLLDLGLAAEALAVATRFGEMPQFEHALELLLHETLEHEPPDADRGWPRLATVLNFVRQFGAARFGDVVMRCARKRDPAVWPLLFGLAGMPSALFDQCVELGSTTVAASYLRIVQNVQGLSEGRRCALKLLDVALRQDDLELAGDLVGFLQPEDDLLQQPPTGSDTSGSGQHAAAAAAEDDDDHEFYQQELLLARHARHLLSSHQLRRLLYFAAKCQHDIRSWLQRERGRAAVVHDFQAALTALHTQFELRWPAHFERPALSAPGSPGPAAATMSHSGSGSPQRDRRQPAGLVRSSSSFDASSETLQMRRLSVGGGSSHDVVTGDPLEPASHQLRFLLHEFVGSRCYEWALLVATVLLRPSVVEALLIEQRALWPPYQALLHKQSCDGYRQLLHYLLDQQHQQLP